MACHNIGHFTHEVIDVQYVMQSQQRNSLVEPILLGGQNSYRGLSVSLGRLTPKQEQVSPVYIAIGPNKMYKSKMNRIYYTLYNASISND